MGIRNLVCAALTLPPLFVTEGEPASLRELPIFSREIQQRLAVVPRIAGHDFSDKDIVISSGQNFMKPAVDIAQSLIENGGSRDGGLPLEPPKILGAGGRKT